ncbi:MAG: c-type cytochrome [Deltaproteobacteria bacterium]|nr:c-type cytochrome [Deltaproteobacteria bacterium]
MARSCAAGLLAAAVLAATDLARADVVAEGREAIERLGCAECHEMPGFDARSGCTGCHQSLARRLRVGVRRIGTATHFVRVPDLSRVTRRLRREYLERYVQDPHDVRPHLEESMPRLPVSPGEARAIIAYLARMAPPAPEAEPSTPPPDRSRVERGRRVFAAAGCPSCHVFGNADFGMGADGRLYRGMRAQALLAPNLRYVRERLEPARALVWILDPASVDPQTTMPRPELNADDAVAVRDFLFLGDPGPAVVAARPPELSQLTPASQPVGFAAVRRIFGRSCIHCHAHTTAVGTVVGLGFAPMALDLSTWQGVQAGAFRPWSGGRRSILEATDGGPPPLIARLLRRHAEAPRDLVPIFRDHLLPGSRRVRDAAPVGMPLGLPPLPLEDLRLIATWIAQGARP